MGKRSTWTSKDDDLLRALAASGENSAAIPARLKRYPQARYKLEHRAGRFAEGAGAEGEEI